MYPALDGQKIDVGYNAAAFTANGSKGVLLLHHFNQSGKRAEVLSVKTAEPRTAEVWDGGAAAPPSRSAPERNLTNTFCKSSCN